MQKHWKIIVVLVLVTLLLIVILQNTEPVETSVLFATVTMPRAALLGLAGVAGFVAGLLTALRFRPKAPKE